MLGESADKENEKREEAVGSEFDYGAFDFPIFYSFQFSMTTHNNLDYQARIFNSWIKGAQGGITMCRIFAGQNPADYEPITRHLRLNGQSTSVRLEQSFWEIIDSIALGEGMTTPGFISKLHSEVLLLHGEARNFTSLLRCACLKYSQQSGTDYLDTTPPAIAI